MVESKNKHYSADDSRIFRLANFNIFDVNSTTLFNILNKRIDSKQKTLIFFANTNFIVKCQSLHSKISMVPSIILNDGVGMQIANRFINRSDFYQNLNGTDLVPNILRSLTNKKIVLLGSLQNDLAPAKAYINHHFTHQVVGCFNGYDDLKDPNLIDKINACNADIVLVGMGNPHQEEWIVNNFEKLNTILFFGVGALFVFMAGNVKRAPKIMRKLRLEWLYRLHQEPKRLFRRYTVDIFTFMGLCLKYKERK